MMPDYFNLKKNHTYRVVRGHYVSCKCKCVILVFLNGCFARKWMKIKLVDDLMRIYNYT